MITEEELKRLDGNADGDFGLMPDEVHELTTEIRRLYAAYEQVRRVYREAYEKHEDHNAFWYEGQFMLAFVPGWLKDD